MRRRGVSQAFDTVSGFDCLMSLDSDTRLAQTYRADSGEGAPLDI